MKMNVIAFIVTGTSDSVAFISNNKSQQGAGFYKHDMVYLTENTVRRGRLFQTGSIAQQLRFVGFFPREVFATEVAVSRGFFVDRVQQIQHLN